MNRQRLRGAPFLDVSRRVIVRISLTALLAGSGLAPARAAQQPAPPAPPRAAPLTLARAQELAARQTSDLTQAELDARLAEEDLAQSRLGYLPIFTAPLSYIFSSPRYGPEQRGIPLSQREPAFIANTAINEYVLLAHAEGKIDVNGGLRATIDKSRAELARARAVAAVARRGLAVAVAEAYYALALAHAKVEIAEETLASARAFLEIASLQFTGGEVPELDTIKARIDVTTRTDELLQAQAAEREAADTLNAMAGIAFGEPTTVEAFALPVPTDLPPLDPSDVSARPELAALDADVSAADAEARIARAERRPALGYSVSTGIDDSKIDPSRDLGASASVTLTIPIFDWGASRSRERQAEIRRESAIRGRELAVRAFRQQSSTARAQVGFAAARVAAETAGVADARRALEISIARYRAGEAPVLEVVDARTTLAGEQTAYFQALYDYHVALARFRQAVGR
jgi:outer membrane protein TolC